jgi:transposase
MSLRTSLESTIPEATMCVARAAFPKGNVFMQMRDALGPLYTNAQFAPLFSPTGQPAEDPARLALVLVMQFTAGLSPGRRCRTRTHRLEIWARLGANRSGL